MKPVITLALILTLNIACSHRPVAVKVPPVETTGPTSVSIMTFNVENLFDTTHDVNKDDYTFLPLAAKDNDEHRARCNDIKVKTWREQCLNWDWSEQALEYKLRTLAQVITQNGGRGPDIIAFQEIENAGILKRLRDVYLKNSGYLKPVLIEGNDIRGIDVAFLTRLPVVGSPKLHPIAFNNISERRRADTRDILQTDFRLPDGKILTGYSVHFPAPFHPYRLRIDAYKSLNALLDMLPADRVAFAAGDFNTPAPEDKAEKILEGYAKSNWLIAHELGCDGGCKGTSYYAPKDDWSFLDMIMVRKSTDGFGPWSLRKGATRLVNEHPQQRNEEGNPQRFSVAPLSGVSDHWPLLIELGQSPDERKVKQTQPIVD